MHVKDRDSTGTEEKASLQAVVGLGLWGPRQDYKGGL